MSRPVAPMAPSQSFLDCPDATRAEVAHAWERYAEELKAWAPKMEAYVVDLEAEKTELEGLVELNRMEADENRERELKEQAEEQCQRMRANWIAEQRRRQLAEDDAYDWRRQLLETTATLQAEKNDACLDRTYVLAFLTLLLAEDERCDPHLCIDPDQEADWRFLVTIDLPGEGQVTWPVHVDQAEEIFQHLRMRTRDCETSSSAEKRERIHRTLLRHAQAKHHESN